MIYTRRTNFQAHPFHLVSPSFWSFYISSTLFATTLSGVLTFHSFTGALRVLYTSLISVIYSMCLWYRDVVNEATYLGNDTLAVQRRINMGVGLFIISEALFFLAIFWSALGIDSINLFELPLLNTVIFLSSTVTVTYTYSHHSIIQNNRSGALYGLVYTIMLAVIFTVFQHIDYTVSSFTISDGIYLYCFYFGTGFQGFCKLLLSLLKMLSLAFLFGLIVIYSKDKYSIFSPFNRPLFLQANYISRLILKSILTCICFYLIYSFWYTASISGVILIFLCFFFYITLERIMDTVSIILGYILLLVLYLVSLFIITFIYFTLYLLFFLGVTISVIIYTLFEVKENGAIYNIYHNNTLYEKNLNGNLIAFGLFIYIVLSMIRFYLLVQGQYVFMNGGAPNSNFSNVIFNPSGGGGPTPPNLPPDTSIATITALNANNNQGNTNFYSHTYMNTGGAVSNTELQPAQAAVSNIGWQPAQGRLIYFRRETTEFIRFINDSNGVELRKILRGELAFCNLEQVYVRGQGQIWALNLDNCVTKQRYDGQHYVGVSLLNIIGAQDDITNATSTRLYPGDEFMHIRSPKK